MILCGIFDKMLRILWEDLLRGYINMKMINQMFKSHVKKTQRIEKEVHLYINIIALNIRLML